MARLTPTSLFGRIFPDRRDPENPGHFLCRFCGKPTIDTRRSFWCSDVCHDLCQKAVSWLQARRETWKRDDGKCVRCSKPVKLYDGWRKVGEGDSVAECHHVKAVSWLWGVAFDAAYNDDWVNVDADTKSHWFAVFYTLLYLDVNNLITLCHKCHKMIHASDYRGLKRLNPFKTSRGNWTDFWNKLDELKYTRTLEDFIMA